MKDQKMQLTVIKSEMDAQLADPTVKAALLKTTFNDLKEPQMMQAIFEGLMRGWSFTNFLKKDVYAIPFKGSYSLISSIDYCRKVAFGTGLFAGKGAPIYEENEDGEIITCEITVKKITGQHLGEFTAKVYFNEYDKKVNLWKTKPRTMISKVAEMHALRMAFPEELDKVYIEEEMRAGKQPPKADLDIPEYQPEGEQPVDMNARLKNAQEKSGDLKMGAHAEKLEYVIADENEKWIVYDKEMKNIIKTFPTKGEAETWVKLQEQAQSLKK